MEEIKKYNENALVKETPQDVKREVITLEEVNANLENALNSFNAAKAYLIECQDMKALAVTHNLKSSTQIQEELRIANEQVVEGKISLLEEEL